MKSFYLKIPNPFHRLLVKWVNSEEISSVFFLLLLKNPVLYIFY